MWSGFIGRHGYGSLKILGLKIPTHRLSYELFNGPLNPDLMVRHTCDNPTCVRPSHLVQGTAKDNRSDQLDRERFLCKPVDVVRAIKANVDNMTPSQLADKYGYTTNTILSILREKTWAWVDVKPNLVYELDPKRVITPYEHKRKGKTFEQWVDRKTDKSRGCWLWLGKLEKGTTPVCHTGGQRVNLRRYFFGKFSGKDMAFVEIVNRCPIDPRCFNPEHIKRYPSV